MQSISDFFFELDQALGDEGMHVVLPLFGAGDLVLQTAYYRATKDSDIFETLQHTASVKSRLQQLAGRETVLHRRHRMYLEFVPNGYRFFHANHCGIRYRYDCAGSALRRWTSRMWW